MKAIIPAKTNSLRVKNKNFRPFLGEDSLFDLKARQLLTALRPEDVYVSSENPSVHHYADRYGFNFLLRDARLTPNETPWSEVITSIVSEVPGDDDILWAQVTDPTFGEFADACETWERVRADHDSLVAVRPFRQFILDEEGQPINFRFGVWHRISQKLPKWHTLSFCMQICKRETIFRCRYVIGSTPYLYVSDSPTVDIDDEMDFETAAIICQRMHNLSEMREEQGAPTVLAGAGSER